MLDPEVGGAGGGGILGPPCDLKYFFLTKLIFQLLQNFTFGYDNDYFYLLDVEIVRSRVYKFESLKNHLTEL